MFEELFVCLSWDRGERARIFNEGTDLHRISCILPQVQSEVPMVAMPTVEA